MNTKERISREALSLFNKSGVNDITTNHIAKAMGISPGNLYYHFQNKEEIIRAIYDQMIEYMDRVWKPGKQPRTPLSLIDVIMATMRLQYGYRFFYREIGPILENDPILKARYQENRLQRLRQMRAFLDESEALGTVIQPEGEEQRQLLAETVWFIIEWGIQHGLVLTGMTAKKLINYNMKMLLMFIGPHISTQTRHAIEQKIR